MVEMWCEKNELKVDKMAEGAGLAAVKLGIDRFAIVLDEIEPALVGETAHHVERRRIAEDADADDRARARPHGRLELAGVHVEGIELDIDDLELEPVLLQRMISGGPRDGRHDHLVAALQRPVLLVEQRGDGEQVGGGAGVHHHRIFASVIGGERRLERGDVWAHGEPARSDDALDRFDLLGAPGADGKLVKHIGVRLRTVSARLRRSAEFRLIGKLGVSGIGLPGRRAGLDHGVKAACAILAGSG